MSWPARRASITHARSATVPVFVIKMRASEVAALWILSDPRSSTQTSAHYLIKRRNKKRYIDAARLGEVPANTGVSWVWEKVGWNLKSRAPKGA